MYVRVIVKRNRLFDSADRRQLTQLKILFFGIYYILLGIQKVFYIRTADYNMVSNINPSIIYVPVYYDPYALR